MELFSSDCQNIIKYESQKGVRDVPPSRVGASLTRGVVPPVALLAMPGSTWMSGGRGKTNDKRSCWLTPVAFASVFVLPHDFGVVPRDFDVVGGP